MKTKTVYEWDYETTEFGTRDIVDHNFADKLSDFNELDITDQLVLVKDVINPINGDKIHRTWGYVKNGILPDKFEDGSKIPIRFKKEHLKYLEKMNKDTKPDEDSGPGDDPQNWLGAAMVFAKAIGLLIEPETGIVVVLENDMKKAFEGNDKIIVAHINDQITVVPCNPDDELENGSFVKFTE